MPNNPTWDDTQEVDTAPSWDDTEPLVQKKSPDQSVGQNGNGFSPLLKPLEKPLVVNTTEVNTSPENFKLTHPAPLTEQEKIQKKTFLNVFDPTAAVGDNVKALQDSKAYAKASSLAGTFGKNLTNVIPATFETFAATADQLNHIPYVKEFAAKIDKHLGINDKSPEIVKNPARTVSEWTRNQINTLFPENPEYANHYASQVVGGLGNVLSMVATPTAPLQYANGAVQVFSDEYRQAKESGADEDTAFGVGLFNSVVGGVLERLPIANALKRVDNITKGGIRKAFLGIATGTIEEGVTEGLQKALSNASASVTYDKTREITDGVRRDAEVGGGVGFILNSLLTVLGGRKSRAKTPEEKQEIVKAETLVKNTQSDIDKKQKDSDIAIEEHRKSQPLIQDNAIQEPQAGEILQRGGMEQSHQGQEVAQPSAPSQEEVNQSIQPLNNQQNESEIRNGQPLQESGGIGQEIGSEEPSGSSGSGRNQEVRSAENGENGTIGQEEKVIQDELTGKTIPFLSKTESISTEQPTNEQRQTEEGTTQAEIPVENPEIKPVQAGEIPSDSPESNGVVPHVAPVVQNESPLLNKVYLMSEPEFVAKHTKDFSSPDEAKKFYQDKRNAISQESASTQKHYDEVAGAKPNTLTDRIPVSPLIGQPKKNIKNIIIDVSRGVGKRILFAKSIRNRSFGSYAPSSTAIKIRYNGDLDTTAHEIGHSIDDHFGVLSELHSDSNLPLENELSVFSKYGSTPPKNYPNPRMYKMQEGFAEWLRAYIVNPEQAIADAPNTYELYNKKVSTDYKKEIEKFSTDIRSFAGSTGRDMTLANIEFEPPAKESVISKILSNKSTKQGSSLSFVDELAANFVNPLHAFNAAFKNAMGINGVDTVLPKDDPRILARLLLGIDGKANEILKTGLIDGEGNVLKDDNGQPINLKWLLEPMDNTDESTIKNDMKDVVSLMVAERTVSLAKRFEKESGISGIGAGLFKDIEVAKKTLEEFKTGDPIKYERITESAKRYREFSDGILKYLVDKGRLAKSVKDKEGNLIGGYDFIKKNNDEYVAMNRVMETEPDREIETNFGGSNGLGSKTDIIKSIKGSSKEIVNPYTSLLDTLFKSIKEADRNDVMTSFRDMITDNRGMHEGDVKKLSDIGVIGKEGDKNAITIFKDGKPEHWIFQKDIYDALKGLNDDGYKLPPVITFLPRALRWSVTNFPLFAAKNIVRDFQGRLVKSEDNSGFKSLFGKKEDWSDLARHGGLNSGYYLKDKETYYGMIEEAMTEVAKNKNNILVDPKKLGSAWGSYQNLLQKAETINRVAEYRSSFANAKKQGMDDYNAALYAAFKSRDLMDFAVMGHWMKTTNQLIPFSNAGVQALRKTVSVAQKNPKAFATRLLLYSIIPDMALWFWNHRDDEEAKEYESLPSYQRDFFYNVKLGDNKWLVVPKDYELSLPSAWTDRMLSKFVNGNERAFDGYGGSVANSFIPVDESHLAGPFKSLIEGQTNYDYFRQKSIIPNDENKLDLSLRNTKYASRPGQVLQETSGIDARKIDHFIKTNFSYYGNTALKLSDIGKENEVNPFSIEDLGFFKQTPAYNSPQVQQYMKYAEKWDMEKSSSYRYFKKLSRQYFDAKDDTQKENLGSALVQFTDMEKKKWEIQNIKDIKQRKHNK